MKEIIYNVTQATTSRVITFGVDEVFSKDNILGIINKTQSKVLYTPVNAANIVNVTCNEGTLTISLADNVPVILADDELFVKLYDTTELAKQGENQDATNTAIYDAVQSKLTPLEAVLTELNNGKQEMVDALATKNVQSSTDKTLSAIADDVRSIAQLPITIEGSEMYESQLFGAPTDMTNAYHQPNSTRWNLYKIMTDLLNDGRLMNYGGIVLGEFQKGDDTIDLLGSGAGGAYLTSDGKLYDTDTLHTWEDSTDGHTNRWVAYLFANSGSTYIINNNSTCPASIHIGRDIGKIECAVDGNITEIVVVGDNNKLGAIDIRGIQKWLPSSIIKSNSSIINTESAGLFNIDNNSNINYVEVGISGEFNSGDVVVGMTTRGTNNSLRVINLPNVTKLNGGRFFYTKEKQYNLGKLSTLRADGLEEISKPIMNLYDQTNTPSLSNYIFPSLKKIATGIGIPMLGKADVKLIFVGALETSLNASQWGKYDGYIKDYSLVNRNIREYIAKRVADGGGTLTFTIGQYLYDNLEQETFDAFTAKNWRVAKGS